MPRLRERRTRSAADPLADLTVADELVAWRSARHPARRYLEDWRAAYPSHLADIVLRTALFWARAGDTPRALARVERARAIRQQTPPGGYAVARPPIAPIR
jgi:hypothetical protein